jgi:hypothetical protein
MQKKEVVQLMYKIKVLFHGTLFYLTLLLPGATKNQKVYFAQIPGAESFYT